MKQINRHDDDGSYSYGYEAADGSFKIETKYPTGEVYGKYGYIGDDGKVREIEYGASRRGFEPAGTGINVPPPTISNNVQNNNLDYDDGQYKEDPTTYYNKERTAFKTSFSSPSFSSNFRTTTTQAPPQQYYQPQPQYYHNYQRQPAQYDPNIFRGHPATNVDINTGSYSLSYSG